MALSLSDIFKGLGFPAVSASSLSPLRAGFTPVTRTLPNAGGTYQSPVIAQPPAPIAPPPPVAPVAPRPVMTAAPALPQTPAAPVAPALDYSKYTDPVTGQIMSPQQYAEFLARRVTGGGVPNYAGNALTQGPQTTKQLESTATDLNNSRNDIATGTTDPYKAASQSGIAYSPTELAAIEKAYAGIYDPALKDVFSKLDKKQKEDASALELKNQLALQAQKHKDDISLKQTPTAAESSARALSASGAGPYVPGANPVVDAWAQRIYNGTAKITDIPVSEKGMRDAVTVALNANGNQTNGKPTTTELGTAALAKAKALMKKFNNGTGTNVVGASQLFGGGYFGGGIPGTDQFNFTNDFNTVKSQLALDAVKYLKGQGSVSDAERALLSQAATELNLSQSEGEFKSTLQTIIDKLEGNASSSSGFTVTDPDGGVHTFPSQAAADEFKKAIGQ